MSARAEMPPGGKKESESNASYGFLRCRIRFKHPMVLVVVKVGTISRTCKSAGEKVPRKREPRSLFRNRGTPQEALSHSASE